jgi:hypothetical protein
MSMRIKELEEKRKYLIGCIEYLEATIEKFKTNEGELEEDFCREQIDFNEQKIASCRYELHQIESRLNVLRDTHDANM